MGRWILVFLILMGFTGNAFAQSSYSANASPAVVAVDSTTTYKNITFPYTTRNLYIRNCNSDNEIWVDLKSDANTGDLTSCILIDADSELDLKDFATDGISIIFDKLYLGGDTSASPVSVLATW